VYEILQNKIVKTPIFFNTEIVWKWGCPNTLYYSTKIEFESNSFWISM